MIQVNNLSFSYPRSKHKVFDGLNLELNESRIYGLLGKNGMGKSTLLYLIAGLLKPSKGTVISWWIHCFAALSSNVTRDIHRPWRV